MANTIIFDNDSETDQVYLGPVPQIVAQLQLTNQTAEIKEQILYGPSRAGLFRVSWYQQIVTAAPAGRLIGSVSWPDHVFGTGALACPPQDATATGHSNGSLVIYAIDNILYTAALEGIPDDSSFQYHLNIVVERLS